MKIALRLFSFVAALNFMLEAETAFANVYASQLKVTNPDSTPFDGSFSDGTGAAIHFILNDNASSVTLRIKDFATGAVVFDQDLGALARGRFSVIWDGTGAEAGKDYFYEITAEQPNYSNTDWTVFYDSGVIGIFTRGCDVVRDMTSPLFGLNYAPNTGGTLLKGITIYNPDGSFHDPFLVAADISNGGTIDWGIGTQSIISGVFDDEERYYTSAIDFDQVRRLNLDYSITNVVTGLTHPKGLHLTGTGAERVLYICDDNRVVRARLGNDDVFTGTLEVVGQFTNFPRNVALDDDGFMYVSFRASNELTGEGRGLNKYDISGTLPVAEANAVWFLSGTVTFNIAELEFDYGSDRNTSTDDILYYSTRAGSGNPSDGVWRVADINFPFPEVNLLIDENDLYGSDQNINDRAAIGLDAAGNIILMENSIEHVFFLAPPGEGATNSFTTASPDTIKVAGGVSVADRRDNAGPSAYRLAQNYPNPFNPTTTVSFALPQSGFTTLRIFNTLGKEVRTLLAAEQAAGEYHLTWDGRDNDGNSLSSGLYVLTLASGGFVQSIRMTLLK